MSSVGPHIVLCRRAGDEVVHRAAACALTPLPLPRLARSRDAWDRNCERRLGGLNQLREDRLDHPGLLLAVICLLIDGPCLNDRVDV
jgi:hypothetical protein